MTFYFCELEFAWMCWNVCVSLIEGCPFYRSVWATWICCLKPQLNSFWPTNVLMICSSRLAGRRGLHGRHLRRGRFPPLSVEKFEPRKLTRGAPNRGAVMTTPVKKKKPWLRFLYAHSDLSLSEHKIQRVCVGHTLFHFHVLFTGKDHLKCAAPLAFPQSPKLWESIVPFLDPPIF